MPSLKVCKEQRFISERIIHTNTNRYKQIRAVYKQKHAQYKPIRAYTYLKLHVKVISFPESVFHEMFSVKLISLLLICSPGARAGGLPCNVPTAVAIEKTHCCSVHSTTLIGSIPEGISDMRVQPLLRALAGLASLRPFTAESVCLWLICQEASEENPGPPKYAISPLKDLDIGSDSVPSAEKGPVALVNEVNSTPGASSRAVFRPTCPHSNLFLKRWNHAKHDPTARLTAHVVVGVGKSPCPRYTQSGTA